MVQIHPDPPRSNNIFGAIAQLGEHLLCKQGVDGSIPSGSTNSISLLTRIYSIGIYADSSLKIWKVVYVILVSSFTNIILRHVDCDIAQFIWLKYS